MYNFKNKNDTSLPLTQGVLRGGARGGDTSHCDLKVLSSQAKIYKNFANYHLRH